jgi:5-(carboxyamino)imidazole ribonucleotide mutase
MLAARTRRYRACDSEPSASYLSRAPKSAQYPLHSRVATSSDSPLVGVIMGSRSDLRIMSHAADLLTELDIPHEVRVVSAHRTPDWMFEYAATAEERGLEVVIAAAGGAAHLPGMVSAKTILPVLGVPIPATALVGVDALLSIVQMPKGVPVGTLAIGEPGAANAALLAASIVGLRHPEVRERLRAWRASRTAAVMDDTDLTAPR